MNDDPELEALKAQGYRAAALGCAVKLLAGRTVDYQQVLAFATIFLHYIESGKTPEEAEISPL